jgi:hypothetical protein
MCTARNRKANGESKKETKKQNDQQESFSVLCTEQRYLKHRGGRACAQQMFVTSRNITEQRIEKINQSDIFYEM